jgi:nucleoid-associated protein YejK
MHLQTWNLSDKKVKIRCNYSTAINGVEIKINFMTNQKLDGFLDLNYQEKLEITGGDTGYYVKGPSLSNMQANGKALVHFAGEVAHNVGDFFRGFFGL